MVRIEFQPPDMDPMVRAVMQNLKLRMTFLKNWANSAAIEARGNARAKGGRRYWKDLARSLQVRQVSETAVSVSSSQIGAGLKQYGGVVRPITARALTIPVTAEAKGKTAMSSNVRTARFSLYPKKPEIRGRSAFSDTQRKYGKKMFRRSILFSFCGNMRK